MTTPTYRNPRSYALEAFPVLSDLLTDELPEWDGES